MQRHISGSNSLLPFCCTADLSAANPSRVHSHIVGWLCVLHRRSHHWVPVPGQVSCMRGLLLYGSAALAAVSLGVLASVLDSPKQKHAGHSALPQHPRDQSNSANILAELDKATLDTTGKAWGLEHQQQQQRQPSSS